jgi:Domain of unknown function (DUF3459)
VPRLATMRAAGRYDVLAEGAVLVRWQLGERGVLVLAANLTSARTPVFPRASGRVFWQEGEIAGGDFAPWTVRWSIDEPALVDTAQTFRAENNVRSCGETDEHA